jgi:hypothetical protein
VANCRNWTEHSEVLGILMPPFYRRFCVTLLLRQGLEGSMHRAVLCEDCE